MHPFIVSMPLVAVAELGDKTQLLALMLAAHYARALAIIAGMTLATLLNHALASWLGYALGSELASPAFSIASGVVFVAMGLWLLKADKAPHLPKRWLAAGAFTASFVLFFLLETGDKTQLATLALAATHESVLWVALGSTLGLLLVNVPVVLAGRSASEWMEKPVFRYIAAGLFVIFGLIQLAAYAGGV
ncbi:MAG: TMEM165/GDT1 family protein [Rickettsiales bacterium]|jgi:putative Ca2+/H+ antiporter (TMEM165/GDT1 family)|nr:TMEM165/GDT1 family protein [Rickettsiales bacterium]